jgi:Putative prokaryotic signal transducing protein
MQTLYEAANAIEAHMLVDLLKQEGITAYIRGEHLQGALGEMPAAGLVRLEIDESEFAQARSLIERWDAVQPSENTTSTVQKKSNGFLWMLMGIIVGFGSCYAFYRLPTNTDDIDHNGDGIVDERWIQSASGSGLSYESDRNFDGKVDLIGQYNKHGAMDSAESDENFDGVFETKTQYTNGNPSVGEVDTDADGFHDLVVRYTHGALSSQEYISPISGKKLIVEYFALGKLMSSEVDTNKDGTLDKRHTFDNIGELKSTEEIKH